MKSIFAATALLLATTAQANFRTSVSNFEHLKYDGQNLKVGYTTAGCGRQKGEFEITLKMQTPQQLLAIVNVVNVSDNPGFCRAMTYVKAEIDLKTKIKELLKTSLTTKEIESVEIQLPKLML